MFAVVFFGFILSFYFVSKSLYKKISTKSNLKTILKIAIPVVLFVMQIIMVSSLYTEIGWDAGTVITAAVSPAPEGYYVIYFSIFNNNALLLFILRFVYSIGKIFVSDYMLLFSIFNIICINVAIFFAYLISKELFGKRVAGFSVLLSMLLVGLSPWLIVPYSDTISMPFMCGITYLIIRIAKEQSTKKRFLLFSLCGVLFAIGYLIKPTVLSILMALVLPLLSAAIKYRKESKVLLRGVAYFLTGILCFAIIIGGFNVFLEKQKFIDYDKSINVPMSYTIAMGIAQNQLKHYGGWNSEVIALLDLFSEMTTEERDEIYKKYIVDKLNEYGFDGYMKFLINKARWITSEGFFFWGGEGGFADFSEPNKNIFTKLYYEGGKHFKEAYAMENGLWIVVLLGHLFGMLGIWFKKREGSFNFDLFIKLIPFFHIILLLVTEARSRYLINCLPIFCIIAAYGYYYIFEKLAKRITTTKLPKMANQETTSDMCLQERISI